MCCRMFDCIVRGMCLCACVLVCLCGGGCGCGCGCGLGERGVVSWWFTCVTFHIVGELGWVLIN